MPPVNKKNKKIVIPGLEEFTKEETEIFHEGEKISTYFDARNLPDSPAYQTNANGAETYQLIVVFPSREELVRAITVLTNRDRKGLAAGAKIGTLNGIGELRDGRTILEMWEEEIFGIKSKGKEIDPDEAQAPI